MALESGTVIGDKYRISRRLGAGGMGEVWAAENIQLGTEVAIKIMLPAGTMSREVYARFKREAQVLGRIRSDYVARVLDFISNQAIGLAMVMELIPGQSLSAILAAKGSLPVENMNGIALDMAHGLHDLHAANIVHRDLKPGNVVITPRHGERARAILIDFGVSRILSNPGEEEITAITRDDRVLGTLEYMAPEQIIGSRKATAESDLYALGAMMYRAVRGQHCFGTLSEGKLVAAKLNQDAPPLDTGRTDAVAARFSAMVARLLSRRPRDRYTSAQELIVELQAIEELYATPKTIPIIQVSMVPSQYEELPTESLSLEAKASILMAGQASDEPVSSSSSNSSLSPAIAPRQPMLGQRVSVASIAMILLMVAAAAAGGVVVGMSIAKKGAAASLAPAPLPLPPASSLAVASAPPELPSAAPEASLAAAPASASASASASAVAASPPPEPSAQPVAAAPKPKPVVPKPKPRPAPTPAPESEATPPAPASPAPLLPESP
jgi:serine/threonine-protein kinase